MGCIADGARLCTAEEMQGRCAAGTGCGHNTDMVWVSSMPTGAASCSDNVKNGDEEGVDCGGSCPEPCPSSTTAAPVSMHAAALGGVLAAGMSVMVCRRSRKRSERLRNAADVGKPTAGDYNDDNMHAIEITRASMPQGHIDHPPPPPGHGHV